MSPLSFQANLMIILKGNFFVPIFCLFKHIIFLLYVLCSIIVKGNFSILIIYSVFANSPPLCNREEFNITLVITLFKLRTKQCTPVGVKLTPKAHSLALGLLNLLTICELDCKLMSFGAIFSSALFMRVLGFF